MIAETLKFIVEAHLVEAKQLADYSLPRKKEIKRHLSLAKIGIEALAVDAPELIEEGSTIALIFDQYNNDPVKWYNDNFDKQIR